MVKQLKNKKKHTIYSLIAGILVSAICIVFAIGTPHTDAIIFVTIITGTSLLATMEALVVFRDMKKKADAFNSGIFVLIFQFVSFMAQIFMFGYGIISWSNADDEAAGVSNFQPLFYAFGVRTLILVITLIIIGKGITLARRIAESKEMILINPRFT
jgi:membrane-associated HD superfamily phosphohydrolase